MPSDRHAPHHSIYYNFSRYLNKLCYGASYRTREVSALLSSTRSLRTKYCKSKKGLIDEYFLKDFMPNDICDIKAHASRYK